MKYQKGDIVYDIDTKDHFLILEIIDNRYLIRLPILDKIEVEADYFDKWTKKVGEK